MIFSSFCFNGSYRDFIMTVPEDPRPYRAFIDFSDPKGEVTEGTWTRVLGYRTTRDSARGYTLTPPIF